MSESDPGQDLPESSLSTFIDARREHALYFLEGQRLIRDLALVHVHPGRGFEFFREVVLGVQPLIGLIKGGEQLGFYVDSDEPMFRFKLESTHGGETRSVLFPPDFDQFPSTLRGLARVETRHPRGRQPYVSVVEADDVPWTQVVNRVLRDSYQVKAAALVSDLSDQSALLHRLPPLRDEEAAPFTTDAVRERLDELRPGLEELFARGMTDAGDIEAAFGALGFRRLSSRPVVMRCGCSRERTLAALRLLEDPGELFDPGQGSIEVTCDYCRSTYTLLRAELLDPEGGSPGTVH